jgi:RNA polymerase-binding transcription factor DksA
VQRIAPKWGWHYGVLLELRDRLLREQGAHRAEAAEPLEPHSMSPADSATDEFDHDLGLTELSAEQDALYEVDEAIKRILNGTYGVCEETGEPIPPERLKAIPWTRFGKATETRLESKGAVAQPHLGALGSVRRELRGSLEGSEPEEEKEKPAAQAEDESLREVPVMPAEAEPQPAVPRRQHGARVRPGRRGGPARKRHAQKKK